MINNKGRAQDGKHGKKLFRMRAEQLIAFMFPEGRWKEPPSSDYKGPTPSKSTSHEDEGSVNSLLREPEMAESTSATLGCICLCIVNKLQRLQV